MTSILGQAYGVATQATTYAEILKIKCPDFVSWNRISFQIFEGTLSSTTAKDATLTGVNAIKYKVQGSNLDIEALYQDLITEQTLTAGSGTSEEVAQQFIYIRVVAKDAVDNTHGKINVNCAGF